jgi:hypothetical protein
MVYWPRERIENIECYYPERYMKGRAPGGATLQDEAITSSVPNIGWKMVQRHLFPSSKVHSR